MLRPSKIICVGKNYRDHAAEMGGEVPSEPLLFLKPPSSLLASEAPIRRPPQSSHVEYEGELGLVIGRRLCDAGEAEARAAIDGVVAVNDVTARDLQRKDSQWARAKGFDTFCPVGEVAPVPAALEDIVVVTRVNGVERQRGRAGDMVYAIPMLLSYISRIMTLEPGDLVLTGTPAGVGPLVAGDHVEVELLGLSRVANPVVDR